MAETAALLADEVLPEHPLRQWSLSLPMALRFLLATRPAVLSAVLGVVYRTISGHLPSEARLMRRDSHTGAVKLIQRFGSALNLNLNLNLNVHSRPAGPGPAHRRTPRPDAGAARADQAVTETVIGRR